jgi:hypothetical protein
MMIIITTQSKKIITVKDIPTQGGEERAQFHYETKAKLFYSSWLYPLFRRRGGTAPSNVAAGPLLQDLDNQGGKKQRL